MLRNTTIFTMIAIVLPLIGCLSVAADRKRSESKRRRIIYNEDGDACMVYKKNVFAPIAITEADLNAVVDDLMPPGSQVDTFLMGINAQVMYYPTKVGTMIGALMSDELRKKMPELVPGGGYYDRTDCQRWLANLEAFYSKGVDPFARILDRAKQRGLETLISYRINDIHGGGVGSPLRCKLWVDHPECRLGYGLDFGHQQVRDYTFELIKEAFQRYECDGLELDFTRTAPFFRQDVTPAEQAALFNGLVERVRKLVDAEEERLGRQLVLTARVPISMDKCRNNGLDPVDWSQRGWIDFLSVSSHLQHYDDHRDLSVAHWKELIPTIPIYGSILSSYLGGRVMTADTYRRAARDLWDSGSDGVYLYNFFNTRGRGIYSTEPPFEVLDEIGDPNKLKNL